jgi:hypothetical protein
VKGRNKVAELLIYVMEIFFVKPLFNMISLCISGHKKNYVDDFLIIMYMYITLLFYLLYQYLGNIKYEVEKANI